MNNQEATRLIRNLPTMCVFTDAYGEPIDSDAYYEAVDMAISALQAQEAKTQLSAEGTTSDLISRQAAIDRINKQREHLQPDIYPQDKIGDAAYRICAEFIERLPSAQPEIEERTDEFAQNVPKEDLISRKAAIDALGERPMVWTDYDQYALGERNQYDMNRLAIETLPSVQPEPHWIPVSERLPEPRVDVWVNSDIGQIQGYYEEHIGIWYASFGQGRDYLELIVTAWMPLPEPYRAERRTDE